MEIRIFRTIGGSVNIYLAHKGSVFLSCREISELLNLDLDVYEKTLINKVIEHENFKKVARGHDLVFSQNGVPIKTYVKRYKEAFAPQLTLLTLEGDV